ncbi:hypothetical protein TWF281_003338 [Arthrobotrys megalospora]
MAMRMCLCIELGVLLMGIVVLGGYFVHGGDAVVEPVFENGVCPSGFLGRELEGGEGVRYCCPSSLTATSSHRSARNILCVSTSTEYNTTVTTGVTSIHQTFYIVVATPIYILTPPSSGGMRIQARETQTPTTSTANPTSTNIQSEKSQRTGAVVGLIIGAAVIAIAVVAWWIIRLVRKKRESDPYTPGDRRRIRERERNRARYRSPEEDSGGDGTNDHDDNSNNNTPHIPSPARIQGGVQWVGDTPNYEMDDLGSSSRGRRRREDSRTPPPDYSRKMGPCDVWSAEVAAVNNQSRRLWNERDRVDPNPRPETLRLSRDSTGRAGGPVVTGRPAGG